MTVPEYMTVREAMAHFDRTRRTLESWRKKGAPGFEKEGDLVLIHVETLSGWVNKNTTPGRAKSGPKKKTRAEREAHAGKRRATKAKRRKRKGKGGEAPQEVSGDEPESKNAFPFKTDKTSERASSEGFGIIEAKRRGEVAKAMLAEVKLKKELKQVVPIDKVVECFARAGQIFKAKALAIPNRLSSKVARKKNPIEVHQLLEREMRAMLKETTDQFRNFKVS